MISDIKPHYEKLKRLFGRTDEITHRRAKTAAISKGMKLEDFIEEAVKEKLSKEKNSPCKP